MLGQEPTLVPPVQGWEPPSSTLRKILLLTDLPPMGRGQLTGQPTLSSQSCPHAGHAGLPRASRPLCGALESSRVSQNFLRTDFQNVPHVL